MTTTRRRIRKISRDRAKAAELFYYDNGVPCRHNHLPVIRLTKTGGCYHCWKLRCDERAMLAAKTAAIRRAFCLHFKKADGTVEVVGPFVRRPTAVQRYRAMYLDEYGVQCPDHYFGPADGTELQD